MAELARAEQIDAATWRHLRWIEPHAAEPVSDTLYVGPGGKVEARCANCGNGEAIWAAAAIEVLRGETR